MQLPLFTPKSTWTAPAVSSLPSWAEAKRIAIDIETRDPQLKKLGPGVRRDGYITGVSFAIEDGPAFYLPVAHEAGGNLDPKHVFAYLRDQGLAFKGDLVTANGQYDLDYLAHRGVRFTPRFYRDVQIADPLICELYPSYSLDNIAKRWELPGKDEGMLIQAARAFGIDPKGDMWRLHAKFVGAYAEQDVRLPLRLIRLQETKIEAEGLQGIYDLESKLMPVLLKMKRRGVRIDHDQLDRVERWAIQEEDKALSEINRLTGSKLTRTETTLTSALVPVLRGIGIQIPKTPTGRDSLTADFLDTLQGDVGGLINRARRFNKLRSTFVDGRREHAINGRVHPSFHQLRSEKPGMGDDGGARYGRLSCSGPNLQQEPARDGEIGPEWRKVYVPEPGAEWACLDYSQQEPRWAIHFAEMVERSNWKLVTSRRTFSAEGASLAGDKYRSDPKTDNHDMMTKLIHGEAAWDSWDKDTRKLHRSHAKNIFLGLCYGMGGAKLCRDLGLPIEWIMTTRWAQEGRTYDQMMEGIEDPNLPYGNHEVRIPIAGPEGQAILDQFNRAVPWVTGAARCAQNVAAERGYVKTVLGRKCHFPVIERNRRSVDPRRWRNREVIYDWCHKAFNRAIQGSSGDQVKAAMIGADEAGLVTEDLSRDSVSLQVHDELDGSFNDRENIKALAEIMRTIVPCSVPHRIDVEVGPNWSEIKAMT